MYFFDIDGTLLDDNPGGKILESTYRTLDKLKENGHLLLLRQEEHNIWRWMLLKKPILIV
ncbi:MAG: HAD hydrolase family protein [Faecalibacillus faecis]